MNPFEIFLAAAAGFVLGAVLVYFYRGMALARLEAELAAERSTKEKIQNEFRLAASEALENTAEQFLTSAIKDLRQVKTETDDSLDRKKIEIASSVSDMKTKLEEYQKVVKKFEEERFTLYAKLEQSLSQVLAAEQSVKTETAALRRVLTESSGVRGQWGERVLQEILEQNDLVKGINFETQVSLSEPGDTDLRPDFVVKLPGGKHLVIDAKEVAGEYVLAQDTEDPDKQKEHYAKLVSNIRTNLIKLSRKEYQSRLDPEVPFVVMFIPSEAAIRAAFVTDPALFHEFTERRVILASPMTIMPLIYLVAHSWQQQQLAQNARELSMVIEELGGRIYRFVEHVRDIRGGIKKASESWDKALSSWQTRVSPQFERAKLLGAKLKEPEELTPIESETKSPKENSS
ncbi:MAG: DNA recombination protein RmuC [Candidatus Omnitrophica bacterium]|nr:DNA recombination protein RmuC [Candidatus Omnitrophota bacterium]